MTLPGAPARTALARLWRWLGYGLTATSLVLLGRVLVQSSGAALDVPLTTGAVWALGAGVLVAVAGHLNLGLCWFLLLREKYPRLPLRDSITAVGLSQVAKYLPGNVAHVLGRAWLLRRHAEKQDIAFSFVVEMALVAAAACLVAGVFIARRGVVALDPRALLLLTLAVPMSLALLHVASRRIAMLARLDLRIVALIVFAHALVFLLFGVVLAGIGAGTGGMVGLGIVDFAGGFALAFLVGYVLPGAPGGLGVREYAFVLLFDGLLPEARALQLILLLRLVTVAGDLVVFWVALGLRRKYSHAEAEVLSTPSGD